MNLTLNVSFLGYSQSLGLVSVSFSDRYDMILSSTFSLLILFHVNFHGRLKHSQSQLPHQNGPHQNNNYHHRPTTIDIKWEHAKK